MKQLLFFALLLCAGISRAQDQDPVAPPDPKVATYVDEPAAFPGGPNALDAFLAANLRYPEEAEKAGIYSNCYLRFVVSAAGDISDITVQRGVENCPTCNKEAIRVVKMMPKWIPGKIDGKPVSSLFNLPIKFSPPPKSEPKKETTSGEVIEVPQKEDGSKPYNYVDEPAEFPGGNAAMKKYLADNLVYPKFAREEGFEGRCYMRFVVAVDGTISEVTVTRGVALCPPCDTEAIRLVQGMPAWIPGKVNGQKVASVVSLPITFHLH